LFEASVKNVTEWKAILNAISDVVDEAMFICNQDGITFRGIDPAHVALLDVTIPKPSFESFSCTATFFGIKIDDFKSVINAAATDDTIKLQIENPNKMDIFVQGTLTMQFSINLIEKSEVNTPLPKVEVKSRISLSPNVLTKIITNIERVSEHVIINSIPEKIQFIGKGDVGNAKVVLEKNNPDLSLLEVMENSSSMYSLEYMAKIIRDIGKACNNVNMEYGTKTPLYMSFEMPSMTKVEYYLAPRIED
jgi:proliferating cell nuclear antigen